MRQTKIFTRGQVFQFFFKERIFVEHLLDLLGQFKGGELQQPNLLLQLRRESQVLRDAQ